MSLWWAPSTEDPNALPLGPFPGTWRPEDIPEVQVSHMTAYILMDWELSSCTCTCTSGKGNGCTVQNLESRHICGISTEVWCLTVAVLPPMAPPPTQLIHFRRLKCLSSTICAMTQQTAAISSLLPLVLQLQLQLQQLERPGHSTCEAFHIPVVSAISLAISLSLSLQKQINYRYTMGSQISKQINIRDTCNYHLWSSKYVYVMAKPPLLAQGSPWTRKARASAPGHGLRSSSPNLDAMKLFHSISHPCDFCPWDFMVRLYLSYLNWQFDLVLQDSWHTSRKQCHWESPALINMSSDTNLNECSYLQLQ